MVPHGFQGATGFLLHLHTQTPCGDLQKKKPPVNRQMGVYARGNDCIRRTRGCTPRGSPRMPQTEHVVLRYGCSKSGEITVKTQKTQFFTVISPTFDQPYLSAACSVWGVLRLNRGSRKLGRLMVSFPHGCARFSRCYRLFTAF